MIRIVGAVSDLQQPPCPDFSRRRYSIDQIEIYIPFVPIYEPIFGFSPQLASFVPINRTSHDLSNLAFERIPLRQSRARLQADAAKTSGRESILITGKTKIGAYHDEIVPFAARRIRRREAAAEASSCDNVL